MPPPAACVGYASAPSFAAPGMQPGPYQRMTERQPPPPVHTMGAAPMPPPAAVPLGSYVPLAPESSRAWVTSGRAQAPPTAVPAPAPAVPVVAAPTPAVVAPLVASQTQAAPAAK